MACSRPATRSGKPVTFWWSKAIWMSLRWPSWVLPTPWPRSARPARRCTCKSCCGRPTPWCSRSTATPRAAARRAGPWRPACHTWRTTRPSASCSCLPSTTRTAMCASKAPTRLPRRCAMPCRCRASCCRWCRRGRSCARPKAAPAPSTRPSRCCSPCPAAACGCRSCASWPMPPARRRPKSKPSAGWRATRRGSGALPSRGRAPSARPPPGWSSGCCSC